jgi:uncharacterized protein YjhX (UPF0386 family)
MSNFKVGQKVVSLVDGVKTNLIKNEIYEITSIETCTCGLVALNVDNMLPNMKYYFTRCDDCGRISTKKDQYKYVKSIYFRPLDHQFAEDVIAMITEQVKEKELVNV